MTTLTEGRYAAEYIFSEANGTFSREVVTLISGQNLSAGTVLGKITASSKYTQLNVGASTGEQVAAAILFENVNAAAADKAAVVTIRQSEVAGGALTWPAGISAPNKATAIAQLAALGIIVR